MPQFSFPAVINVWVPERDEEAARREAEDLCHATQQGGGAFVSLNGGAPEIDESQDPD